MGPRCAWILEAGLTSDLVQLPIIAVTVENPGELHYLGLFIDRIDDPVFTLCDSETGEAPIGEVHELFRIRRRTKRCQEN